MSRFELHQGRPALVSVTIKAIRHKRNTLFGTMLDGSCNESVRRSPVCLAHFRLKLHDRCHFVAINNLRQADQLPAYIRTDDVTSMAEGEKVCLHSVKAFALMRELLTLPDRRFVVDVDNSANKVVVHALDADFDTTLRRASNILAAHLRKSIPPLRESGHSNRRDALAFHRVGIFSIRAGKFLREGEHVCN